MEEQLDDLGARPQQALRDRYPADREAQGHITPDDIRALRRGLRDLSNVTSGLAAYLIGISAQADAGSTGEEPQNREQMQVLQEEAAAIRERFPKEHP